METATESDLVRGLPWNTHFLVCIFQQPVWTNIAKFDHNIIPIGGFQQRLHAITEICELVNSMNSAFSIQNIGRRCWRRVNENMTDSAWRIHRRYRRQTQKCGSISETIATSRLRRTGVSPSRRSTFEPDLSAGSLSGDRRSGRF